MTDESVAMLMTGVLLQGAKTWASGDVYDG